MVREAVYGWGMVGRGKAGRTNDGQTKDVVPLLLFVENNLLIII